MAKQLPAGMRNNNPGNIKYVGQAGTSPSSNLDQGDPQAVFASPEAGMSAMYTLLGKKYRGGKVTPNMIIAGQGGWTPGNAAAAANVARTMGIGPDDDIGFNDPARAGKFMRALMLQEHGNASLAYTDAQINAAIGGGGGQTDIRPAQPTVTDGPKGQEVYKPAQPASQYALPRAGRHPPEPTVGTGGYVAPGADATGVPAAKPTMWQNIAKNIGKLGGDTIAMGQPGASRISALPAAARLDQPDTPTIDPQQQEMQRQQLAMVMQRLNSGRLF